MDDDMSLLDIFMEYQMAWSSPDGASGHFSPFL